ncbi:DJ-1/PfpI family protein [Dactylosporangium cerinum]
MTLSNRSIVVFAFDGYQELEFWYPVLRAREEGAEVKVVGPGDGPCESHLGYPILGDTVPDEVVSEDVDALVVPGTVTGRPAASDEQVTLLRRLRAAEVPIFASGSGAHLVRELVLDVDPDRVAVDADALPPCSPGCGPSWPAEPRSPTSKERSSCRSSVPCSVTSRPRSRAASSPTSTCSTATPGPSWTTGPCSTTPPPSSGSAIRSSPA